MPDILGPYEPDNIYCGECAAMMAALPDGCIDLTVTSPPYDLVDEDMVTHSDKGLRDYQGYEWDFVSVAKQLYRVTAKGGVVVWVVGDQTIDGSETGSSFRQALYFKDVGFRLADTMIYKTTGTGAKGSRKTYWQSFDFMFILSKNKIDKINAIKDVMNNKPGIIRRPSIKLETRKTGRTRITEEYGIRGNVWQYDTISLRWDVKSKHPAAFPEALARDHIISWSNPGDLILDPFIGSGTTAKMAIETGRRFLGFDISQEYIDLAKERIKCARIPLPGII